MHTSYSNQRENQQSHVLVATSCGWAGLRESLIDLKHLSQTHCKRLSLQKCDFVVCVVLSGFLDSGERVSTGELMRAPRNVARLHLLWPLTVAPPCPPLLLLCCCSHSLAAKCWHTTQCIVWHRAKFRVWVWGDVLLTQQQSEKMHTIAIRWVIYPNCSESFDWAPV